MAPVAFNDSGSVNGPADLDFTKFYNVINGKLTSTKVTRHGVNPATLKDLPEVPVSTREDVDAAMKAAEAAFKPWATTSYDERRKLVLAFGDEFERQIGSFVKFLTKEQGKPTHLARLECGAVQKWIKALSALDFEEELISETEERQTIIRYTPLGVVVGIVPWNFPVQLAVGKIAPSLLTGNPIIIKPSPFTPYCGLKLGELAQKFFPPGVVQVLSGDDNLGPWLTAHPTPAKVSFTGSSATGKKVMESASKTLKRVTLELGGNDPAIICPDIDIAATAPKIASLAFLNSGQTCAAIKRIYVHSSIYAAFLAAMVAFTRTLRVGPGTEDGVALGPIQNAAQYEKVRSFFTDLENDGSKIAVGGDGDGEGEEGKGYFVRPTIVDNPPSDARVVVEEAFGPLLPLLPWTHERSVIARANSSKMGLGASVWSRDVERANRIARQLDAGSVWVNAHLALDPRAPFGGHKESGIGVEWGVQGLRGFCNCQTLYLGRV
ncbi:aldehyde dehydrogenase [Patellaria atrata CBS 101060]|uniref:aldehyde dehydrogenase (NAD(+)) n=1 Tax=Patellaria atrata CBS 101060 TaxID=1346257 RepID=A0A9P4SDG7_9PEZI|nr:aldehyde dehydrogenase [Patellaria atrata CBS 101060]